MVGRPARIKSKGSEASTSQDGDAPRSGKRHGRPRKSKGSDFGSRESSPFSPSNHQSSVKRQSRKGEPRLVDFITEFDQEEDLRSHRLARFLDEHPDGREEYARLIAERPSFPPWIEEKDVIEHDGTSYRTGDIVCVFDEEDLQNEDENDQDLPYYAQIRSLITDQFMRAFAWITWLAPKESALDAHEFVPDHFMHTLIDHKLYELECLRWVDGRPELPAYQIVNEHLTLLDKHRQAQFRARRTELFKAANFEEHNKSAVDVVRAGDVRTIHTKEHEDDLKEVLDTMAKRDTERRENEERMHDEEEEEDEDEDEGEDEDEEESGEEEEEGEGEEKKGSDESDAGDKSGDEEGEEVEEEDEDEKPPEMPRDGKRMMLWKRGNITTITKPGAGPPKQTEAYGAKPTEEG